ncbi:MAG TPA: hypothetical protein VK943_02355, partial [Arenibaculum sp.]|nr:hypothetical protein [Arenibaculum sp.]
MRMHRAIIAAAGNIGLLAGLGTAAYAQSVDYTRLHQMLIQEYPAAKRDRTDAPAAAADAPDAMDEQDLLYAAPPSAGTSTPSEPDQPSIDLPTADGSASHIRRFPQAEAEAEAGAPEAENGEADAPSAHSAPRDTPAGGPVAAKDRYLIQFQPTATQEEVQDILNEYNLRIIPSDSSGNSVPEIGLLHVERLPDPAVDADGSGPENPKSLHEILDPPIVR